MGEILLAHFVVRCILFVKTVLCENLLVIKKRKSEGNWWTDNYFHSFIIVSIFFAQFGWRQRLLARLRLLDLWLAAGQIGIDIQISPIICRRIIRSLFLLFFHYGFLVYGKIFIIYINFFFFKLTYNFWCLKIWSNIF